MRSDKPIANLFFKMQHKDTYFRLLPEEYQRQTINKIQEEIMFMKTLFESSLDKQHLSEHKSRTFMPFFDSLDEEATDLMQIAIDEETRMALQIFNMDMIRKRAQDGDESEQSECRNCGGCHECYNRQNDYIAGF